MAKSNTSDAQLFPTVDEVAPVRVQLTMTINEAWQVMASLRGDNEPGPVQIVASRLARIMGADT